MKQQRLSNIELSSLCQELELLLHAGMLLGDGLSLLAQEEGGSLGSLLADIGHQVDLGVPLSSALEVSGVFPNYMIGLLQVGERTGHTEQALRALSQYYARREEMEQHIRSALTYPAILLMLMLVVIVVLLSRVLPIFDEVYASLGGHLTGIAGGLLLLGQGLNAATPLLVVLLAIAVGITTAFALSNRFRVKLLGLWQHFNSDQGICRKMNDAHIAQSLSMGLSSGLPLEETLALCSKLLKDIPSAVQRCEDCIHQLENGVDLAESLRKSGVLPASSCRLLALGLRGGAGDSVMEDIARRLSEDADQALEQRVAQVEPILVLSTSVLVGAILLSVMLPLMNIMTVIG